MRSFLCLFVLLEHKAQNNVNFYESADVLMNSKRSSISGAGLPHTDLIDDMEIKPVNPIDGLETRSQSSMSEDLPVDASSTPTPPTARNSVLNIPDGGALSSLGGK